jgi:hypothetical protein
MPYLSGIRTRDPSSKYAADLRYRPRAAGIGWDAQIIIDAYLCSYTRFINQIVICITQIRVRKGKSSEVPNCDLDGPISILDRSRNTLFPRSEFRCLPLNGH